MIALNLSITDIVFVIYFVIAINDSLCTQCLNFKVGGVGAMEKIHGVH